MFWGKKKVDDDKDKQIKQLKDAFPSLRRPNNDDSLFEIRFTAENQSNALKVFIPADFPLTRPVLQVSGPVEHPWLGQFKQVNGCQKLMNWSKNTTLVEVVEECLTALQHAGTITGQPTVGAGGYPNLNHINPVATAATSNSHRYAAHAYPTTYTNHTAPPLEQKPILSPVPYDFNNYTNQTQLQQQQQLQQQVQQQQQQQSIHLSPSQNELNRPTLIVQQTAQLPAAAVSFNLKDDGNSYSQPPAINNTLSSTSNDFQPRSPIALPEIPRSFPEFEKLNELQLERLLHDEIAWKAQTANFSAMESLKNMHAMRDDLRKSNAITASSNVMMEEELNQLHFKATVLQNKLRGAIAEYMEKYTAAAKLATVDPAVLMQELRDHSQALDESSEDIGRKLVSGEKDLAAFTPEFLEARTRYHTLQTKIEMMNGIKG